MFVCLPGVSAAVIRDDQSDLQKAAGVPLYVWEDPDGSAPQAVLVAVHGSAQEGSVFDALARDLVPHGFVVIAPDIRGNGRWLASSNSGQFASSQLMQSCDDLTRILRLVNRAYPGMSIFCLGESIGAGVVLNAVTNAARGVKGAILVSAGVRPHMHNPQNMKSSFIKGMALLIQPVDLTDYITRYCSEDPRIIREMLNDPLAKNRQSGLDLLGTFSFLRKEPQFAATFPKNIPVLIIQGAIDQIVDPSSVSELLQALPGRDKQLAMIPECGHIIVGTHYLKPQVLDDIHQFLMSHGPFSRLPVSTSSSSGLARQQNETQ
jgi:alpha-beta hydrolase superfamily lysophospholipase